MKENFFQLYSSLFMYNMCVSCINGYLHISHTYFFLDIKESSELIILF